MAAEQPLRSSSRFAATYRLLRQYVREQQQSGGGFRPRAVTMSLMPGADVADDAIEAPEAEEGKKTMELFPQRAGMLQDLQERKVAEKAPLTIFYGGRVLVFDDFPSDKAEKLMQLAGSDSYAASDGATAGSQRPGHQPAVFASIPIARSESLQRFLEKRKNRLAARDPYSVSNSPAIKDSSKSAKDEPAPWLGVGSPLSLS